MNNVPEPIPIPTNFPITWENPTDADLFWFRENVHFPDPVKPLDHDLCVKGIEIGFSRAAHFYQIPGETYDRSFNTYIYEAVEPPTGSSQEIAAQLEEAQQNIEAVMPQMETLWQTEWLPEIKQHLNWWESYDLATASLSDLAAHIAESQTRFFRLWEVHFHLFFPMVLSISLFQELYEELFPDDDPLTAYSLLAGFPNKTIESDLALWQLSRQAGQQPDLEQLFSQTPLPEIMPTLRQGDTVHPFLTELENYLYQYGRRGDRWSVLAVPWIEDPTPVLKSLQEQIKQPQRDLPAEIQHNVDHREIQVNAARARLASYPQPVISTFESQLKAAQVGHTLKEEHSFWIDFLGIYSMRQVCLAMGERLVEHGLIHTPAEVFYLHIAELRLAGSDSQPEYPPLIEERRALETHFATITPPLALGTTAPEMDVDDPISRAVGKVMGGPIESSAPPSELHGSAGSAGVVQGIARILHTLDEAPKLGTGEILVASMTTPSWTPLFATAAAIVTDGGGVLSHAAIVAREYGIPAVVNTGSATTTLHDGQSIEVDGSRGIIRILTT